MCLLVTSRVSIVIHIRDYTCNQVAKGSRAEIKRTSPASVAAIGARKQCTQTTGHDFRIQALIAKESLVHKRL